LLHQGQNEWIPPQTPASPQLPNVGNSMGHQQSVMGNLQRDQAQRRAQG